MLINMIERGGGPWRGRLRSRTGSHKGWVPAHVRDEFRIEAEWTWFPIGRLRYVKTTGMWSLYWRGRNLRFYVYDLAAPTASIEELLAKLDRDPTAIFWG